MKHVTTVMNISTDFTQCELIYGLRRDHFIMKLIKLLIGELSNCSLGSIFESRAMPKRQFDRFSLGNNFKKARSCNMEFPDWVQVKKYTITDLCTIFIH